MKFHIVGNGENVDDILKGYDLTIDELKSENKHIRIWNNLIPGTKLKIPVLSESLVEDINEIEPFIEDYYPKIKIENETQEIKEVLDFKEEESINQEIIEENNSEHKTEQPNENKSYINLKTKQTNKISGYYVYPRTCYYRPIIYVIPRR